MTADVSFEEIGALSRAFIERELRPIERDVDLNRGIDESLYRDLIRRSRRAGIYSHNFPSAVGGADFNALQHVAVSLEAGRISMGLSPILMGPPELVLKANPEQWSWFAGPCIEGEALLAVGLTEPSGGSDLGSITTKARPDGDDFLVTGNKAFTSHAERADFIVVLATSNEQAESPADRFTALIVRRGSTGLHVQEMPKMGWHGSSICEVTFDAVRVPRSHVLGRVHHGWDALFGSWINGGRLGVAATCAGSLGYALELAAEYARGRTTFGSRLGDHQVIQFWLADMQITFDAAVAAVCRAADCLDGVAVGTSDERTARRLVAGAKVFASEALGEGVDRLVQIFGGAGLLSGTPVERLYRDSRIFRIGEGSSEMLRKQIGRSIMGRAAR